MMVQIIAGEWVNTDQIRRIRLVPSRTFTPNLPVEDVEIYFHGVAAPESYAISWLTDEGRAALEGVLPEE